MALFHFSAKVLSRGSRNTVRAIAYRAGCQLYDTQTGQTFNYADKSVQHVELLLPKDAPLWARDIQELMKVDRQKGLQAFVDIVEASEKRIDARVWREFEFALHRELTEEQNIALAREFVEDHLCGRGMAAQLNFHFDVNEETGEETPHCHVVVTTRRLEEKGLSLKKERDWNSKTLLLELREQWAQYSNFHLKLHGHAIQIDHRSHKDRGIEIEPQPKRGRGVSEQENRYQKSLKILPITDKAKAFHDVQLRNLYRIIRRPEVVFDIVTKHHATFMWADVRRVLHRYVDEVSLFQRLEAKLKNSAELVLLHLGNVEDSSAHFYLTPTSKNAEQDKAIYTTRRMLKAERSLIEAAEGLSDLKTHGVDEKYIKKAIEKANEELRAHGGLSQDQIKAIHHLVDEGQIKCVVGIAGAGKTTALGVCQDIWKTEGYAVYGLAPTGKASQNLEHNNIQSQTLHKFLKACEEGRCQYHKNSVLVLDEAGMVDVERFEKLLGAVKQLGVKLIVVGDGAQLQPVEAGPAFRLVTTRIGKVELNTIVRQKEAWQREVTVLFGKQETQKALQKYVEKGAVHIVDENLSSLKEVLAHGNYKDLVKLYEASHRVSALIYHEMIKDVKKDHPGLTQLHPFIKQHQDYSRYQSWKELEKEAAKNVLQNAQTCRPLLEERCVDPLPMALLYANRDHEKAKVILKENKLDHLLGIEKSRGHKSTGKTADVRDTTKTKLIQSWHLELIKSPEKSFIMLAYSNRDVNDLNRAARSLLKESGHIATKEFVYTTKKQVEDDFGRKTTLKEEKAFSKGDRIVFTRNNYGLGVKNGTMGTIMNLNSQKVHVKLDEGKEISFAPNLNPYFDHGWAITIHKSQGTTVDHTYVLASYEMTQNLAYVAMTRHRDWVKVFGSSLDFWRTEKLPEVLSKSGEKLSAADYLDADSLSKLMQTEDRFLTKIFERIACEFDAMGTVSKKAFWQVADHFLGTHREHEIRINPDSVREEVRAEELFKPKQGRFHETSLSHTPPYFTKTTLVEEALKQKMALFADDIFSSIGEYYNRPFSSATERRYGKKGHISVNVKTGAWIDYKNSDMSGGPLHLLTKVKGLSFKEAVDYGASWAGIGAEQLYLSNSLAHSIPSKAEKEKLENNDQLRITKAQALWEKGKPIQGTLAERYLREHRKIKGELPQDLRYLPSDNVSKRFHPSLMAVARSPVGEVTAVQLTFLDPQTAAKAKIEVAKRSFGVIKGSAVTLQETRACPQVKDLRNLHDKIRNVLFIAEGVETALSIKEAGVEGTIKASLGLSNISRLTSEKLNTHIIICADHDAQNSPASENLNRFVKQLEEKGSQVTVIKPDKLKEDFNDVLKAEGPQKVRELIERGLNSQKAFRKQTSEGDLLQQQKLTLKPKKADLWQKIKASFIKKPTKSKPQNDQYTFLRLSKDKHASSLEASTAADANMLLERKNGGHLSITEDFKRKMIGDEFYQKSTSKRRTFSTSNPISEKLKQELLGEEFYTRASGKTRASKSIEAEKTIRASTKMDSQEDHVGQDISIFQKPPSRGRRR
ncbi:MAG: hypothetical protein BGO67_10450 [Alphaproteobacteria bacterium 41-28]|nr:MAG: hypothetical protein BGO67_10450 [Alphaproteobacteria bacterium 41-28]